MRQHTDVRRAWWFVAAIAGGMVPAGCDQGVDLGTVQNATCSECDPQQMSDASADDPYLRPRFDVGTQQDLDRLTGGIQGWWHGSTWFGEAPGSQYEIRFIGTDSEGAVGTFEVRCLEDENCAPLGFGSELPHDDNRYAIAQVHPDGSASGFLRYQNLSILSGRYVDVDATIVELRLSEDGEALSIRVWAARVITEPFSVLLTRGRHMAGPLP